MSIQQGNNIITNQLAANHDGISNRPVSDNFSSSRSYAPECKFNHFSIFFLRKNCLVIIFALSSMKKPGKLSKDIVPFELKAH